MTTTAENSETYTVVADCHCGAVTIEAVLTRGKENYRRCNCSLCRRKGAVVASVELNDLRVVDGVENLAIYQWNTKTAKHYFCKTCGIYTHHQRRSNPNQYGLNTGCIVGFSGVDSADVALADGAAMSLIRS
ncbi:MAG: GFA family protein [Pseudomonadota bacterium]